MGGNAVRPSEAWLWIQTAEFAGFIITRLSARWINLASGLFIRGCCSSINPVNEVPERSEPPHCYFLNSGRVISHAANTVGYYRYFVFRLTVLISNRRPKRYKTSWKPDCLYGGIKIYKTSIQLKLPMPFRLYWLIISQLTRQVIYINQEIRSCKNICFGSR